MVTPAPSVCAQVGDAALERERRVEAEVKYFFLLVCPCRKQQGAQFKVFFTYYCVAVLSTFALFSGQGTWRS